MLIVSGGYDGSYLSSTEVFDYSQGSGATWRRVGALPAARSGLRGASMAGVFYVSGGEYYDGGWQYSSEILAWNPGTEAWTQAGSMKEARGYHTFTEVTLSSVFCD